MSDDAIRAEIERMCRVADQSCSAHAHLSQRYERRALGVELVTLVAAVWVVSLSFVNEPISGRLAPFDWDPQIWAGCLGIGVFFLTLFQTFVGWKAKAEAHRRSSALHAEIKAEAGQELLSQRITTQSYERITAKYNLVGQLSVAIPESEFLKEKRRHKLKVAISKRLDEHPSTSIFWMRVRYWWRDNVSS